MLSKRNFWFKQTTQANGCAPYFFNTWKFHLLVWPSLLLLQFFCVKYFMEITMSIFSFIYIMLCKCFLIYEFNMIKWKKNSLSSLPWNQTSLLGYFAETCFEIIAGMTYYLINGVMMLLYISLCIHDQAFYHMVKHSIDKWTLTNDKNDGNNEQFLRNLIRFHISAKE